jgi:hypothetical protein
LVASSPPRRDDSIHTDLPESLLGGTCSLASRSERSPDIGLRLGQLRLGIEGVALEPVRLQCPTIPVQAFSFRACNDEWSLTAPGRPAVDWSPDNEIVAASAEPGPDQGDAGLLSPAYLTGL